MTDMGSRAPRPEGTHSDATLDRLARLERRELDDGCVVFTARFSERSAGLGGLDAKA